MKIITVIAVCILYIGFGCSPAYKHSEELHSSKDREMTLGIVQREIRLGMRQDEVATVLGSPNIVTNDKERKETWIYDKIATEVSSSADNGNVFLLIVGYQKEAGARSSTQKTLTVVIKFDEDREVEKVSYHSSKF